MSTTKSKIKYSVIIILAFCILLIALIYFFRVPIVKHFIPKVRQTGEVSIQITNDTSIISSKLLVINKSFLKIKIDSIKYEVSLHEKIYLQSEKLVEILLSGYETDTIDFSLNIPYRTILADLKAERKNNDSITYSVHVSLVYSTILGKIEIPIDKSAKFKIPRPPEISIEDISYKKIRFKYIIAEAKIKIINHSDLNLSVKTINYSMIIVEQGDLKGALDGPIKIAPKSTSYVYLPIEIGMEHIGLTVYKIIMNKDKFNYILNLHAILEVKNPLQESFHIHITRDGIMELVK